MYKLIKDSITGKILEYVLRLGDGAFVHRELNSEYLKWLAEGNEPLPADE